jgi:hypothetical protein
MASPSELLSPIQKPDKVAVLETIGKPKKKASMLVLLFDSPHILLGSLAPIGKQGANPTIHFAQSKLV